MNILRTGTVAVREEECEALCIARRIEGGIAFRANPEAGAGCLEGVVFNGKGCWSQFLGHRLLLSLGVRKDSKSMLIGGRAVAVMSCLNFRPRL